MGMFVPCPHCGFLVALIAREDGPPQRCPRCDGLVQSPGEDSADAEAMAAAEEIGAAPIEESDADAASVEPAGDDVAATDAVDADADAVADPAPAPSYEEAIAAVTANAAPARARRRARPRRKGAPSFARHAVIASPARTSWRGYAIVAGLALLLALQLLLAQRNDLAADPRWRPLVASLCGVLQCELPPWHEPAAFTMLQRGVRPKAGDSGVLAVEASFRNDAQWPQPWPALVLSLSDVDGRPVGQRAFTPDEYRQSHRAGDALLPGQSATVAFDVVEPAPRIVAFSFDFR